MDIENGFRYLSPIEGKRIRSHSLGAMTQTHDNTLSTPTPLITTSHSSVVSKNMLKPFNNKYYSMFSSCCELNSVKHPKKQKNDTKISNSTTINNSRSISFTNETFRNCQFMSSSAAAARRLRYINRESTTNPKFIDTIDDVYREKRQSHPHIRCSYINNYFEILKKNREYFSQYDVRLKSPNMPNIVEFGFEENIAGDRERMCRTNPKESGNFSATLSTTDSLPKFRINDEHGRRVPISIDSDSLEEANYGQFDSLTFDNCFDENNVSDREYVGDAFDIGQISQTKCCERLKLCKKCVYHLQKLENKFSVSYDE